MSTGDDLSAACAPRLLDCGHWTPAKDPNRITGAAGYAVFPKAGGVHLCYDCTDAYEREELKHADRFFAYLHQNPPPADKNADLIADRYQLQTWSGGKLAIVTHLWTTSGGGFNSRNKITRFRAVDVHGGSGTAPAPARGCTPECTAPRGKDPNVPRVRELIVQYRLHPSGAMVDGRSLADPAAAAAIVIPLLEDQPVEVFIALHLDAKRHLIGVQEVTRGDLAECQPAIRSIMTAALGEKNTHALILAHNHPSGDPSPSPDDLAYTLKVQTACRIFGIEVLDHLIVGDGKYISLQASGRMRYL